MPAASRRKLTGLTALAALRQPIAAFERRRWPQALRSHPDAPPVIIVGHWRSGTTHLGNLLAASGRFAYVDPIAAGLPNELLTIGRSCAGLLERSVPSDRLIDRVPVTRGSPQEDEFALANMQDISFLHGLYFPQKFEQWINRGLFLDGCSAREITRWEHSWLGYLHKLQCVHRKSRLLLRNPMFTARLPQLRKLIPDLRIIHIHRHPLEILRSMRNYYTKLLPKLAWQPYDHVNIDRTIVSVYARMMDRLIEDSAAIPDSHFFDLGYADLSADPQAAVRACYERFGIPGFDHDWPQVANYLSSIGDYQRNAFRVDPADAALVKQPWQRFFEHWGYTCDGSAS